MIELSAKGTARTCDGLSRRDFMQVGALGAVGMSLEHLTAAKAQGAIAQDHDERNVIMIFNLGAPSQLDTWDMKPEAPSEVRGPFQPIQTDVPDLHISELFPRMVDHADKISYVRSCYHTAAAVHDTGHQMLQTGRLFTGGVNTPHAGCVLAYLRGRRSGSDLPPHVLLPEPMGRTGGNLPHGQDAGFLGKSYDPFALMADPSKENFQVPDLLPPPKIEARLGRRQRLRAIVDNSLKKFEATADARLLDSNFQEAYRLMTSQQARDAFDLSKVPRAQRERYGVDGEGNLTRFGQCCLLSVRLLKAGVRFVTINTFLTVFDEITWDIHGSKPFTSIEGMKTQVAPAYDTAFGALLDELSAEGLLDNTLVCNLQEFGRTPRINPAGGRDHWPQCWTSHFAGGGVKGGRVIGRSDAIGGVPVERPVEPAEIVATIFHSLGLNLETTLPGPQTRPFPLVNFGVHAIEELF